jgi:urease accessory protein
MLLLAWMSPAFPTGSFAYSHGLEWAIESGAVRDADALKMWISDLLQRGSGWNDAVIFAQCWGDDVPGLNALALALAGSRERWLETTQLGAAFTAAASVWPAASNVTIEGPVAYPVAAGSACRSLGVSLEQGLVAYLQGFAQALVSVGVRLIPLGQTQGLVIMRDLMPLIATTARRAIGAMTEELGSCTVLADIAAMKHETLSTRIFRT